jgi:phthiodiolone/phenolphthiodiolone dimycocerosates ketoreductase
MCYESVLKSVNRDTELSAFPFLRYGLRVVISRNPSILGAFGPRMLTLTGELGDGWMPFSHTPETYRKTLYGPIKEAAERNGRVLSEIEPALLPAATISRDREEAMKSILTVAKNLLSLLPEVLSKCLPEFRHPGTISLAGWMGRLDADQIKVIRQVAQEIPDESALETVIWGKPDDCIAQLDSFIKSGCRHFVLGIRGKNRNQAIELFGKEVLPYFKELSEFK